MLAFRRVVQRSAARSVRAVGSAGPAGPFSAAAATTRVIYRRISTTRCHQLKQVPDNTRPTYPTDEHDPDLSEDNSDVVLRGTDEVRFGRKHIGMVVLPQHISDGISQHIEGFSGHSLRHDYLRLIDAQRSTGSITPRGKGRGQQARRQRREERQRVEDTGDSRWDAEFGDEAPKTLPGERLQIVVPGERAAPTSLVYPGMRLKPHTVEYGPGETAAYMAALAPSAYAATFNVLDELRARVPGFKPTSVLDFGAGPGCSLWAAQDVWANRIRRYVGIDSSEAMIECAQRVLDGFPSEARPQETEFLRYLVPDQPNTRADLVISAFTLSELPSDALRQATVETLWHNTNDTLVLIDRGSPNPARIISDARAQLIALAARDADQPTVQAGSTNLQSAIHTVAPFPNELSDPTNDSPAWLHFSQRVQRPRFTMRTKHSKSNGEVVHYSYVIMRRGPRPPNPQAQPSVQSFVSAGEARSNPDLYLPSGALRKSTEQLAAEAYYWPRIIMPPIKRKGHVVTDVCTVDGKIERWTYTKIHSKQGYRDARKASWGDLFPHQPKSAVVRPYFAPPESPSPDELKKMNRKQRRSMMDIDD
ncbi:37S ribosomal protein S22 [Coemansia erecta]|nr:37S ribosomal protein S22 [Coemansia erecta]